MRTVSICFYVKSRHQLKAKSGEKHSFFDKQKRTQNSRFKRKKELFFYFSKMKMLKYALRFKHQQGNKLKITES